MSAHNSIQALIEGLVACDEQPSDERLTEFRQALEDKVMRMKQGGRVSILLFFTGIVILATGFLMLLIASTPHHQIVWLTRTGFAVAIMGAVLTILGSIGLLMYRGFGYVWARHDFHDAAIMELSMQVRQLSQQVALINLNKKH